MYKDSGYLLPILSKNIRDYRAIAKGRRTFFVNCRSPYTVSFLGTKDTVSCWKLMRGVATVSTMSLIHNEQAGVLSRVSSEILRDI